MNNEPVAIRYDFDGYGYQYMDSGSGSDWQTRVDGELLYTHPVKEQEPDLYSEDGFPLWTSPQFRELTIKEIDEVSKEIFKGYKNFYHYQINFARAILRKAQEK